MKSNKLSPRYTVRLSLLFVLISFYLISCSQGQKKDKDCIGLQLWSVRADMKKDPAATIETIGKIGYGFIEAAGYDDGKFYGMEPDSFRMLVEKNGLKFLSSHAGKSLPDSASWDSTMVWWDTCIKAHKTAGVKYIIQPSMDNTAYECLDNLQKYCDYFNVVGEKCKANGIQFGYHNHTKEFNQLDEVTIYDYMLQHTDSSKVIFECDVYWAFEGGANVVDYFKKYPGRFELLHIKDKEELGSSGKMDFKSIFDNSAIGGTKYFCVEVEEYNFEPLVSVKKSYEFLENSGLVK